MTLTRVKISEADRRHIIGVSGGCCNFCKERVFQENEFGERARLGDDAHIVAASNKGPRGESSLSAEERASADNLLLLCKTCHSKIDQQPKKYPVTHLLRIRSDHYKWVEACMGSLIMNRPRFHYLSYINIPRAHVYSVVNSFPLPTLPLGSAESIRELGINAGRLMAAYVGLLNHEELYANRFDDQTRLSDLTVGSYWFSDEATFRTKKVRDRVSPGLTEAWRKQECVIYRKFDDWRLVCMIDPRWVTTATASVLLSSGTLQSMGLVHINSVDERSKIAWASPLFLGAPDKGWGL